MLTKKEAENILLKINKNKTASIPVLIQTSKITSISSFSRKLVTNRITIKKYNERYALKRSFYKPITIFSPKL